MITEHTESAWLFRWDAPEVEVELAWVPGKREWQRRTRVRPGGWTDALVTALPTPRDLEHAERIAHQHAGHAPAETKDETDAR